MNQTVRAARDFRFGRTPRLMILSVLVGTGAGAGAVLLIEAISLVATGAEKFGEIVPLGKYAVLLVLPATIWASWKLTAWFAPEVAGHGVPQIIAGITARGGAIRTRVAALKTIATALTIGGGGSAGREGSIAQIGASIGSWAARTARVGQNDVIALVAAGAGAGISATFNAPIAGMFFAMEVILREFSIRHLHTIIIASVSGAVVAHSLLGDELTFRVPAHSLDDPRQLLLYGALGLVAVAFGWLFLVALDVFETRSFSLPAWARPVLFGLTVALLGLFWDEALGTGQDFVNSVLRDEIDIAWWSLGVLAVVKALATSITLGGRGSGGIFMPSLFIGATAGSGFARLVAGGWTISEIAPGAFGLVGMAATFAAVARAPLTSILIVFEITGDYGLVLPLMIATAIATIIAGRVRPESAYTAPLARMGIHPTQSDVTDILDTVTVGETMRPDPPTIEREATLGHVQGVMQRHRLRAIPVVADGRLVGILTERDIIRSGGPSDQVTAGDAMTPNPITATPTTPVSDALERMAALGVGRLPVVDDGPDGLVGMFERDGVVGAYHRALGARSRAASNSDRLTMRTAPQAGFSELQIPPGSVADGRQVREVPWPEGCLLVSVHRGTKLLVPTGDTVLHAGDAITALGSVEARDRLAERLARRTDSAGEDGDEQPDT